MPGQDPGGEGGGKADVEAAQVELNIMTQAHKHTSTSTQAQVQLNIMAPTAVSLVVKALVWWQHLHSWLIDPQVQVSPIGGGRQELCSRSSPEEDCTKAVGILSGALHLPIIWS